MGKREKYVVIHDKPMADLGIGRFLGHRVHPGLSAAICWLEKHYPESSKDIDKNFDIVTLNHEKLTELFVYEMDKRIPEGPDKDLLMSMLASLLQGRAAIRMPIKDVAEINRRIEQSKSDRAKNKQNKQSCSRFAASEEFRKELNNGKHN